MFNFFKTTFTTIYQTLTNPFVALFAQKTIDQTHLTQLQELLLKADTGVKTTNKIIAQLKKETQNSTLTGQQAQSITEQELFNILNSQPNTSWHNAKLFLLIGINGSGKTTFSAKLAHYFAQQNKKTMLVAADTFRAAASTQLQNWANKINCTFVANKQNQEPASVVFDACVQALKQETEILIIDTAGRLENKQHLMTELAKIKRIIEKKFPTDQICTLLTIDAMLGQNSFDQARIFHDSTHIDGIVLTKMDSTAKGGIVFHIVDELKIPILFIAWGEQLKDMAPFNAKDFIAHLFDQKNIAT